MDISEIRKANLLDLIASKANGSQKDFANAVPTSPAYISQIINGTIGRNGKPAVVGTAMARKIEKSFTLQHGYMDVPHSQAQIKFDNNVDLSKKIDLEGTLIPVISWVAAGSFSPIETVIKDTEIREWLPPNKDCGKNGYGLIVTGMSMSPYFLPDDRIYVNPDIQTFDLKTDDLVIVACSGDSEATFKKLIIEGNDSYLQPLNPNWPDQIIKLTEDCKLVGKVVGLYRKI
ncbi:S24 family peptidase [Acinetobacter lwoffii]|jgi:SOS-response transcriptional repressor LexA|uniref:S24 family peptidase n=1 Tax=Acinetobacter lwoffii TaxID=28090 RepID=UPI00148EF2C3|nr:S24 family peptidase [Acinetobacter lwoffii]